MKLKLCALESCIYCVLNKWKKARKSEYLENDKIKTNEK